MRFASIGDRVRERYISGARAIALGLCLSACVASNARGADSCLTPSELESLRQKNLETLRILQYDEVKQRSAEYVDVMREVLAARREVETCTRENEGRFLENLGIPQCNAKIRKHNQLVQKKSRIEWELKTRMDMINKTLELNRMTFRACD